MTIFKAMINFFREIRHKFADNNQFFKYSRYAIGEIVLVVIGILIALSINNWNEKRKDRLEMIQILKNLKVEFKNDLSKLEWQAVHYDSMYHRSLRIIYPKTNKRLPLSYINAGIASILWAGTYDTGNGILESIIASGKIDLIKNNELNTKLAQWDGKIKETQDNEIGMRTYVFTVILPILAKFDLDFREFQAFHNTSYWETDFETDDSELRNILIDLEFRGLAKYRIGWLSGSKNEFKNTKGECKKIIELINYELNRFAEH